ncbi:hypothetical protein [Nocardia sp. NPDC051570]|uniref:hypothetical protein n=1 Tax=Nocardia sp. NPDC051570 TaxID=3364324 RepID=UPI00379F443C
MNRPTASRDRDPMPVIVRDGAVPPSRYADPAIPDPAMLTALMTPLLTLRASLGTGGATPPPELTGALEGAAEQIQASDAAHRNGLGAIESTTVGATADSAVPAMRLTGREVSVLGDHPTTVAAVIADAYTSAATARRQIDRIIEAFHSDARAALGSATAAPDHDAVMARGADALQDVLAVVRGAQGELDAHARRLDALGPGALTTTTADTDVASVAARPAGQPLLDLEGETRRTTAEERGRSDDTDREHPSSSVPTAPAGWTPYAPGIVAPGYTPGWGPAPQYQGWNQPSWAGVWPSSNSNGQQSMDPERAAQVQIQSAALQAGVQLGTTVLQSGVQVATDVIDKIAQVVTHTVDTGAKIGEHAIDVGLPAALGDHTDTTPSGSTTGAPNSHPRGTFDFGGGSDQGQHPDPVPATPAPGPAPAPSAAAPEPPTPAPAQVIPPQPAPAPPPPANPSGGAPEGTVGGGVLPPPRPAPPTGGGTERHRGQLGVTVTSTAVADTAPQVPATAPVLAEEGSNHE